MTTVIDYLNNSKLAGEADGHIWIPEKKQVLDPESKQKADNPRFHINFHIKDKPLAEKIREIIGEGFIRLKLDDNACVLTISSIKGLKTVITMVNGKMRTPKIYQLHLLVDWINNNFQHKNIIQHFIIPIDKLGIDNSSLHNNCWFTGFSEGDGGFGIRYTQKKREYKEKNSLSIQIGTADE